ncbi:MAG: DUF2334 domain-containing protein [Fibrobacteria bacterium]|nr:DUF2334 domain-containing protein [Fibrobacteria bacterium]
MSPLTWDACMEWIDLGRLLSLPPMDLFVIPRHEGGPLDRGAGLPREFVGKLRDLHGQGHRLWIHGWTHRGEKGEDEFADMDAVHAVDRVRRALNDWKASGLPDPDGFCPPCWAIAKQALPGICRLGLREIDLRMGVWSPEGLRISPALSSWGGGASLVASAWDRTLVRQDSLLRASGLPRRVVLHPQDLDGPSRGPLETILDRVARDLSEG